MEGCSAHIQGNVATFPYRFQNTYGGIANQDASATFLAGTAGFTLTGTLGVSGAFSTDVIQGLTGTTGTFVVKLVDNLANALQVQEAANPYLRFVTTNSAEAVNVYKTLQADTLQGLTAGTGLYKIKLQDNLADALTVQEATNAYLTFVTTDGSESVDVVKALRVDTIKGKTGTTGTASYSLVDNLADAFSVQEGTNKYLTFATTDGSEQVNATKRLTTTDGIASGTVRVVGGRASSTTALSTTISGGSGAQSFDQTYSIPASTLLAGSSVRIRGQVKAIGQNGTDSFTVTVRVGGSNVAVSTSVDIGANDRCPFDVALVSWAAPGASVTVAYNSRVGWSTAGAATTFAGGTLSLATNGALVVDVQITYGTNSASNQAALEMLLVDVI